MGDEAKKFGAAQARTSALYTADKMISARLPEKGSVGSRADAARQKGVFIPSQLLTGDFWAPLIAQLHDAIDATVANHTLHDSIDAMARSILAEAPDRFILLAHAMGGFVAFEMLRQQPNRIEKLVLISTQARNDSPAQTERRAGYLRLVEAGNFARVVEERIPILLPRGSTADEAVIRSVRRMAYDTGAEAFLRQQRAIIGRPDNRPLLPEITCPTLIIFGRQDGVATLVNQQEMVQAIPNSRLKIVEDCGHLVPLERTSELAALVKRWI